MMKAVDLDAMLGVRPNTTTDTSDDGLPAFNAVLQQETRQLDEPAPGEPAPGIPVLSGVAHAQATASNEASSSVSQDPPAGSALAPFETAVSEEQLAETISRDVVTTGLPGALSANPADLLQGGNRLPGGGTILPESGATLAPMAMQAPGSTVASVSIQPLLENEPDLAVSMVLEPAKQNPAAGAAVQLATAATAHQADQPMGLAVSRLSDDLAFRLDASQQRQAGPLTAAALDEPGFINRSISGASQIQSVIDPRRQMTSINTDGPLQFGAGTDALREGPVEIGKIAAALGPGRETVTATLFNAEMIATSQARLEAQPLMTQGAASLLTGELSLPDPRSTTMNVMAAAPPLAPAGSEAQSALRPLQTMMTPAQQPGWDQEFGSRINYMIRHDQQVAELRLNPASLGVVEVRISTENDKAEVSFFAQNAATRELIEAALPKLRETLAANGVELEQAQVSGDEMPDRQNEGNPAGGGLASADGSRDGVSQSQPGAPGRIISSDALVDTFI